MPADPQSSLSPNSYPRHPKRRSHLSVWIVPIFFLLLAISAFVVLLINNPTAREVTAQSLVTFFSVLTTPFILEVASALVFIFGLLAYNKWRRHKEGSDWVYLVTQKPDSNDTPLSPSETQRLQSTVLTEKPEPVDELENSANVLEGYLELGMSAQALAELPKLIESHGSTHPRLIPLRIRILSANLETEQALNLIHETLEASPHPSSSVSQLVQACLESSRWLLEHLERRDLASIWLHQAHQIHPLILADDDPLRTLNSPS